MRNFAHLISAEKKHQTLFPDIKHRNANENKNLQ